MKHGSLPRWIARSLPVGAVEPDHAPDGLTESDVDALAAEAGIDLELPADDQPVAPVIPLRPPMPWGGEAA
jgi:hypothetical protein